MAWIVKLVSIGAEGEEHGTDIIRITKPDDLADLVTLGTLLAKSGRHHSGPRYVRPQLRHLGTFRPVCPVPGRDGDLISRSGVLSHVARRLRQQYPTVCRAWEG